MSNVIFRRVIGLLPWAIAIICIFAAVTLFARLEQVPGALAKAMAHLFHDHRYVRQFEIHVALDEARDPIIIMGDSITEMARLPAETCGHPIVNAGISGARAIDFLQRGPRILDGHKPAMILVALGANESGNVETDYAMLFTLLGRVAPKVAAISDTNSEAINSGIRIAASKAGIRFDEIAMAAELHVVDGIHFNEAGYARWLPAMLREIAEALC